VRHSLLSVLFLTGLIATPAAAQTTMAQPSAHDIVIASGEGVIKRAPDQVFVTVAAEARSRQPNAAQGQNARVATAIRARLETFALAADAVRTMSIEMQPEFDWADGKQTLRGYLATNVIEIRLDDVTKVGEVLDAVIAAGATRITGVRFTLEDLPRHQQEALTLASAAALARARAMAEGVSRAVDRVVRLEESGSVEGPRPPMPMMRAMAAQADVPVTPVTAGDVEVRVTVTLHASLR